MEYTQKQLEAIEKIKDWYRGPKPYFHLAGYAGTGKTVTTRGVIDALRCETETALCAYTAKAAKNLSKKSKLPASTIHRTIYSYRPNKELTEAKKQLKAQRAQTPTDAVLKQIEEQVALIQKLTEECEKAGAGFQRKESLGMTKLIVADECSMIAESILSDLLSFGVKVLFVGDHGQLPPIAKGGKSFYDLIPVDYELTEIKRHDNDIVQFADMARHRSFIPFRESKNGFGKITKAQALESDYLLQFDQVICHRNVTRRMLNRKLRELRGFTSPYPAKNEKVVCRFNNHKLGISRGTIYLTLEPAKKVKKGLSLEIIGDEDDTYILRTDPQMFDAYEDYALADDIDKQRAHVKAFPPPFDFGYAITCHSAQGSEWDKVLVWDDYCGKPEEGAKWLYTAITRAETEVIIAA